MRCGDPECDGLCLACGGMVAVERDECEHGKPYTFAWSDDEPVFLDGPDCEHCYPETL